MIIDGHAHLWKPSNGFDIKPIADEEAFRTNFLIPDLRRHCADCGIDRVVITQSAPQVEETEFLLSTCRDEPLVSGVTGWIDLTAADGPQSLDRLMQYPKFVGIRVQLRRMPDDAFINRDDVRRNLDEVVERDLSVVLLAEQRHWALCLEFLRKNPDMRAVLNHGGMPDLVSGDMALWRTAMRDFARQTNVAVQVSGFVSLAGERWTQPMIELVFGHLLDCFGPDRLMFASDWPMTELHASYRKWWEIFNGVSEHFHLSNVERGMVLGGVVRRIHALDHPGRLEPLDH